MRWHTTRLPGAVTFGHHGAVNFSLGPCRNVWRLNVHRLDRVSKIGIEIIRRRMPGPAFFQAGGSEVSEPDAGFPAIERRTLPTSANTGKPRWPPPPITRHQSEQALPSSISCLRLTQPSSARPRFPEGKYPSRTRSERRRNHRRHQSSRNTAPKDVIEAMQRREWSV